MTFRIRRSPTRVALLLIIPLLSRCGGDSATGPGGGDGGGDGGPQVAAVTVSPQSASIEVGGEVQMSATARDASGAVVAGTPTWTVAPTSVASISASGLARGISAGTATVTATIQNVQGTAPVVVTALPPTAPTGLGATATSSSAIDLAWEDNSDDETGFRIQRSPDGTSGWSEVATTEANATSYEDTGLDEGTRYFYRVAAVRDAALSDWSDVADATTLQGTAGTVASIQSVIEDVLPPAGTPLENRNLLDEVRAVAERLADLPGVDTVVVLDAELSVETLLDDGTMHLFINSRPEGASTYVPTATVPAPGARGSRALWTGTAVGPALPWGRASSSRFPQPQAPRPATDGPPGSRRAVVVSHDGGAEMALKVRKMVADAGYQILPLGTSLDDMRQYTDLGVLHLDTHGVAYQRLSRDNDGTVHEEPAFALQTSTVAGSDLTAYSDDLDNGRLALATAQQQDGSIQTKIAITENFIAKYWSFDDGVVMLHACYGGGGPGTKVDEDGTRVVDPSIVRLTMLGAGARIVVAFDNLTWWSYAEPSVLYFFDRVLGANSYEPEDPPLRPFDIQQVHEAMQEEGLLLFHRPAKQSILGISWGGNDVNVVFDDVGERATLAPSIQSMDVVDDVTQSDGRLTLNGLFGAQKGTVEVEGASMPIESWSDKTVVARVPFEGTGSAGPVVVKRPDQVKSNEAPLTEWRGTVTLTTKALGTLTATATMAVRFRADVHAFRDGIMDDPHFREVPVYVSPASTGTSQGSGSYTKDGTTETWFGQYDMNIIPKAEVDQGVFPLTDAMLGGSVRLDPDKGTAEICLGVWGTIGVRVVSSGGTDESTSFLPILIPDLVDRTKNLLGCVDADLDDDTFVISGDDRSTSKGDAEFSLEWTDFYPFTPPTDQTPG